MTQDATIWTTLPLPALIVSDQETIIQANPAAEAFFHCSERSLQGMLLPRFIAVSDAINRALDHGAQVFVNEVAVATNAKTRPKCDIQIAPLTGHPSRALITICPREMARLVSEGSPMKSAARSAVGMAEMLAHEIKNPLAGITGAAQLLSMSLSDADRELTDLIVAESRRIVALLDQVEEFGNLTPPKLRAVNIHDVLDRARRSASLGIAADMQITEDYDPSLPLAASDPDPLVQVIQNLLKNSAEAAPGGGKITLRSYYDPAMRLRDETGESRALPLQIEVQDNGPGLPENIAANVFEPFVSGRENGTGLGLALAAKLISDQKGWISVTSEPGRTVFRISLPRAPQDMEE